MYKIYAEIQKKLVDFSNKELINSILNWLRTELTYTSNHIEGNTLTREETALTIEEGITSKAKPLIHYIEARNHAQAFDYIVSLANAEKISYEDVVLKIHSMLLAGIDDANAGIYRSVRVRIAGSTVALPNPIKVPHLMEIFAKKLDSRKDGVLKALEAHYKLVEIHPFVDGNGRAARLLMNLILMRAKILPLIIPPIERKRYISAVSRRNSHGDLLHYYNYMLGLLDKSMNAYGAMFARDANDDETEMMTISKFAKYCDAPVSTIRYYLRTKRLAPKSYTRAGYMLFAKEQAEIIMKKREMFRK